MNENIMGGSGVDRTGQAYSLWRVNMTLANQAYLNFDAPTHREIPLTQGYVAIVDDDDYQRVMAFKWHISCDQGRPTRYAITSLPRSNGNRHLPMHRFVLGLASGSGIVDHINGNGLDNRKSNLRVVTPSQNSINQRMTSRNTSGFKGVRAHRDKWQALICVNRKTTCLGTFPTKEEAHAAYVEAAKNLHGNFTRTK